MTTCPPQDSSPETKAEVRFLNVFLADLCGFLGKGAEDWA